MPDAIRCVKPLILLLSITTSAASVIPVLLKLMIGSFNMLVSFIEVAFKVSKGAEANMPPFTINCPETMRDGVAIESLLEIERDDAFISPKFMFSATTVPIKLILATVIVPEALILRA